MEIGQGDTFSNDEKVILGEVEPDSSTASQETQVEKTDEKKAEETTTETTTEEKTAKTDEQPEHTEEEQQAAEKQGFKIDGKFLVDDEGTKIPLTRWRKFYAQGKEIERGSAETAKKFNLFRELGPEKFYELYPEDKPAGYKPPATREERPEDLAAIGSMVVNGGPYNGQTLNEVFKVDPGYAQALVLKHHDGQRSQETTEEQRKERERQDCLQEVSSFSDARAGEMFGGKKYGDLTEADQAKVDAITEQVLAFNAKKRTVYDLEDAYFLMNREGHLKAAHEKGGKAALESLKKPGIASVDTTNGKATVSTDYESMTRDQLSAKIEGMTDAQAMKFYKDAPASVKAKFPDLPWE